MHVTSSAPASRSESAAAATCSGVMSSTSVASHTSASSLPRDVRTVNVLGHDVRVKVSALPDGRRRAKPEYEDVRSVAEATGRTLQDVTTLAHAATERA